MSFKLHISQCEAVHIGIITGLDGYGKKFVAPLRMMADDQT